MALRTFQQASMPTAPPSSWIKVGISSRAESLREAPLFEIGQKKKEHERKGVSFCPPEEMK